MESLIYEISSLWEDSFPDIPCLSQSIYINTLIETNPRQFKLLIVGATSSLRLEPFVKINDCSLPLAEDEYSVTIDKVDNSLTVLISDKFEGIISGLIFECLSFPEKALKIVVMQRESDLPGEWTVCYNSFDRQSSLIKLINEFLKKSNHPNRKDLFSFLFHLIEGKENAALANYENSNELKKHNKFLQNVVDRYHRQLNNHGLKRTFKYWSPKQKQSYLHGAQIMIEVLNNKFPDTCIGFGAVLGLERDGDLIGHDDDIDILVALPLVSTKHLPNALSLVGLHLQKHGYKIEGIFFSHLWVRTPFGDRVDVFVGLVEKNGKMSFYPSARRSLNYKQVFPTEKANLLKLNLPFPRMREDYLRQTYGDTWRQPDPHFAHPWDRLSYRDLDGPRRTPAIITRGEIARMNSTTELAP